MSNDDLFENNEIILDDALPAKIDENVESKEAGFSIDDQLRRLARSFSEKLNNVDKFNFGLYSTAYYTFVSVPKLLITELYDSKTSLTIAPYKLQPNGHSLEIVHYLLELNRKIMIMGYNQSLFMQLLRLLEDNTDGEQENSFLVYFRNNLRKEVIFGEIYLNSLLETYSEYCDLHDITKDENLIEFQLKTKLSSVEFKVYGPIVTASQVEQIGDVPDFVKKRDDLLATISKSAFEFINHLQSAIDEIKNEQER